MNVKEGSVTNDYPCVPLGVSIFLVINVACTIIKKISKSLQRLSKTLVNGKNMNHRIVCLLIQCTVFELWGVEISSFSVSEILLVVIFLDIHNIEYNALVLSK